VLLVGFGTYFVVFNLGAFASFFSRTYSIHKARFIEQMKNSSSPAWRSRGERFVIFQPRHENIKPSEWMIALFMLHKISRVFRSRERSRQDGTESEGGAREHRAAPTQDVTSWQDIELPVQLSEEKMRSSIGMKETRKESSIRDGFARLGRAFTSRRGALSPPGS
jgi:hypothetical protein